MSLTQLYDFHGKTALITGASGGLGEQFARCLSIRGARVILASRRIDKLNDLAEELGNAKAILLDVADKKSVFSCFTQLEKANEKIDICINNAGIAKSTAIFEEDQNGDFELLIQTNLMGVWFVTKAAANYMKNHGIHGSIINIASVNGDCVPAKGGCAYSISKAGVIHLTKTLVGELSLHKIRINCISPGLVRTPMTVHILGTEQQQKELANFIPLGFIANPQDLDSALLLLASNDHSTYITGTNITIDGGISWGGKSC